MTKLNQILAVERGAKGEAEGTLTKAYHLLGKTQPITGIARTYKPKDEEGDQLPPESTLVQVRTKEVIDQVNAKLARMFDVVATKELTNTKAKADVSVDGELLLTNVPATVLLFLEKQLENLHTFIRKLPVLDPAETWTFDENRDVYVTEPTQTTRTKKVPRNHVKAEPTERHPAQVEMYFEDVIVGTWTTTKFSGALPAKERTRLTERVRKLQEAVKTAREEANLANVEDLRIGRTLLDWVFVE